MPKFGISGGFLDGSIRFYNIEKDEKPVLMYQHLDPVTTLISDQKEKYIISGSQQGDVIFWKIVTEPKFLLQKLYHYYDHDSKVTSGYINTNCRLFSTCSEDGSCNIYFKKSGQIIHKIYHPNKLQIKQCFIVEIPFVSIVFYSGQDNSFYVYSINGLFVKKYRDNYQLINDIWLIRDFRFNEYIVFGDENGNLNIRTLPEFEQYKKINICVKSPILCHTITKDNKFLMISCEDEQIVLITDDMNQDIK